MKNNRKGFLLVGLTCLALVFLAAPAMAVPISGTLNIAGTFTEAQTFLNFCFGAGPCAAAPGNWNAPGAGTGDLAAPYADDPNGGLITNLNNGNAPVGTLLPGNGILFLTFAVSGALPVPNIEFYVTEVFGGVGGTANCFVAAAPGQTCTPTGSSVTFLNGNGGNSSATITAVGKARRISTNEFDALSMVFTSQFNTPYQTVLGGFLGSGSVTNAYSATFTATPAAGIPEPLTLSLLGLGLIGFGMFRRFRVR